MATLLSLSARADTIDCAQLVQKVRQDLDQSWTAHEPEIELKRALTAAEDGLRACPKDERLGYLALRLAELTGAQFPRPWGGATAESLASATAAAARRFPRSAP